MYNNIFDAYQQNATPKDSNTNATFSFSKPNSSILEYIDVIQFYYTPVIVVLGICGNVTSALVLRVTKLRKLSSSYFLFALVLADTGFLLSLFFVWLELAVNDVIIYNSNGGCQIVTYVTYVCSFLSIWYVVAFTVERFIAIEYPLRRPIMCTVSRAKMVVFAITLLALVGYLCVFSFAGVEQIDVGLSVCTSKEEYLTILNIFNLLDTFFTLVLPFILIVVLNIKIVRRVWKLERFMDEDRNRVRSSVLRTNSSQIKITKMLVLVSSVVLCFNFPSYAVRLLVLLNIDNDDAATDVHYVIQQVSQLLFNTNFAINFILYCVSGANFRRALNQLCRCNIAAQMVFQHKPSITGSFVETSFTHINRANNKHDNPEHSSVSV